ncbi:MAG: electron transfer flavoprotein subunit alpha/FixB family protein [Thermoplasmatota archaeon]
MVLVYSEDKNMVLELIHCGTTLQNEKKQPISVICFGTDEHAQDYITHGADFVYVIETEIDRYKAEEYSSLLAKILEEMKEEIILIGSDKNGKELAPRLAAQLQTGCVTDCSKVYFKDSKLTVERIVYSGNAIAVEQFNENPSIITIPAKVYDPLPVDTNRKGEIINKKISVEKSTSTITDVKQMETKGVNVEDADIIVSCGRGIKDKKDIQLISDLADALKGKTIGCSRPISADLKWLSEDHWIGLSGHKVKPKLYIAAGISGQIQHIAGMRDSGIIVAINKDPEALIFKSADFGIVGDIYDVLPKLTQAIKTKMG